MFFNEANEELSVPVSGRHCKLSLKNLPSMPFVSRFLVGIFFDLFTFVGIFLSSPLKQIKQKKLQGTKPFFSTLKEFIDSAIESGLTQEINNKSEKLNKKAKEKRMTRDTKQGNF